MMKTILNSEKNKKDKRIMQNIVDLKKENEKHNKNDRSANKIKQNNIKDDNI